MAIVMLACYAMKTRFELILVGNDEKFLRAAGEEAIGEIIALERLLTRFQPESDIGTINRVGSHQPVRIDARTFLLLQRAKQLSQETKGAFDITVGTWWEKNLEAKEIVGADNLLLDETQMTACLTKEGLQIDLGGIGKGYTIEQAAEILRNAGIENAFLHGGTSSVFAFGRNQDGNPWQVAIAHPVSKETIATVTLDNLGLSVSVSQSALYAFHPQSISSHSAPTIEPTTGKTVTHTLLAAVVLPSPTVCDAWSTALLVLGKEGLAVFQQSHPEGWSILLDCEGKLWQVGNLHGSL